jgi:hypothetical protein
MKKHTGSKETFYVCAHARSIENVLSGISLEQEKKSCFTLPFFDLLKKHWCVCVSEYAIQHAVACIDRSLAGDGCCVTKYFVSS